MKLLQDIMVVENVLMGQEYDANMGDIKVASGNSLNTKFYKDRFNKMEVAVTFSNGDTSVTESNAEFGEFTTHHFTSSNTAKVKSIIVTYKKVME